MKVDVASQFPCAYTPRTLTITFESQKEEDSFRTMCESNITTSGAIAAKGTIINQQSYGRNFSEACLLDMLGTIATRLRK